MTREQIIQALDEEIARWHQVRNLLAPRAQHMTHPPKRGPRRRMSAEARARIGAAQRKRWRLQKARLKAAA
jgi:hypothetical protein